MLFLRQSTAVDIVLGPFLDATDAVTPMTALTLSQADIRLKKNAAGWAQKNDSNAATHEENGNYECALNTTDTDTLGRLRVHVNEATALPVWEDYHVIPQQVYDSLILGSDLLHVDSRELLGVAANTPFDNIDTQLLTINNNVTGLQDLSQADIRSAVGLASADLDAQLAAILAAAGSGGISVSDIFTGAIEGSLTLEGVLRILLAAAAGKSNVPGAGQRAYRDQADSKNRILATVAGGDRTSVTVDSS